MNVLHPQIFVWRTVIATTPKAVMIVYAKRAIKILELFVKVKYSNCIVEYFNICTMSIIIDTQYCTLWNPYTNEGKDCKRFENCLKLFLLSI